MKKFIPTLVIIVCFATAAFAQGAAAPVAAPLVVPAGGPPGAAAACGPICNCDLRTGGWFIVFTPVALAILGFLFVALKLKGYDLKEALRENEPTSQTIINPQYTENNIQLIAKEPTNAALASALPPTVKIDGDNPKSSSRYLALITTVTALVLAVSMVAFSFYGYLCTGNIPDIGRISTVLLSLGVGVVPYAFNRISNAIK